MQPFPINNIGQQGGAPDASPYELTQNYAHTAYGMRYYRNQLTASTQAFKLNIAWQSGGVADSESILAACFFGPSLWVVRAAGNGANNSIYSLTGVSDSLSAIHRLDWGGPSNTNPNFIICNNHLIFSYDNAGRSKIVCSYDPTTQSYDYTPIDLEFPYGEATSWYRINIQLFKNFFVAIRPEILQPLATAAARKSNTFIWSDLVPYDLRDRQPVWDALGSTLAGETILNPAYGELSAHKNMGDRHICYSNNAAWAIDYIGGNQIFSQDDIFTHEGATSRWAVCEIPQERHAVMGSNKFYIHDGRNVQYPGEGRINRFIKDQPAGIRWAEVVFSSVNQDIIIVPINGDDYIYFYNLKQDAWTWVKREAFLPGVTRLNRTEDRPTMDIASDFWTQANPALTDTYKHKARVTLFCTDNGLFLDPYSTANPYQIPTVVPFNLVLPYMDLSHITKAPNAYRYHWLHKAIVQARADGLVNWEVRTYNEFPQTQGGNTGIYEGAVVHQATGQISAGTNQFMDIDGPGRYISMRFFAPESQDSGLFSLDGITCEISPNAYRY